MGETLGRVHSVESFGSADGPGVRYIVFLKGCNMRCKYCHNPDTWAKCGENDGAKLMTPREVLKTAMRYKAYWKQTGGITVSGGEALLQIDFVTELFKLAKENGVNTCLDTSGNPFTVEEPFFGKFNELMKYTDLFMLDIKHIDDCNSIVHALIGKREKIFSPFLLQESLQSTMVQDKYTVKVVLLFFRHLPERNTAFHDETLKRVLF